MGIFDKAKDIAGEVADKAAEAIDKVGDFAEEHAPGKLGETIGKVADKASDTLDKVDGQDDVPNA